MPSGVSDFVDYPLRSIVVSLAKMFRLKLAQMEIKLSLDLIVY